MRVLKTGENQGRVIQAECDNCGSHLEFSECEVERVWITRYDRSSHVKCPVCDNHVHLGVSE